MFLKERQTACKPGSVPPEEVVLGRGWPFLWDARCRAPRATDPSGGAKVRPAFPRAGMPAAPTWSCSRWGFPCRSRCRRRGALLPHRFTLAGRPAFRDGPAVYFLWHFPWGRPRRALPGTVPPWSPDFPPSAQGGERPSGRLALENLGIGHEGVEVRVLGFRARGNAAPRNDN